MAFMQLIVGLVVVGVVLWFVNQFVPMDDKIRQLINVVVVLAICIWLLRFAGFW